MGRCGSLASRRLRGDRVRFRRRFADVISRQLDVFAEDEAELIDRLPQGGARVQRGRARRGRSEIRRLRRRRRDRDRGARRHARPLQAHARRGRRRGVRRGVQPGRAETLAALRTRDRPPLMARIEDYALIGDLQTAALVSRDGSIDWLCLPRFDSGACFAALLGDADNGRWLLAPAAGGTATRRYLHDTLVLETTWTTDEGSVRVLDFMPPRDGSPEIVRIVEGLGGRVPHAVGARDPLRLRPRRAVGASHRRRAHRDRRTRRAGVPHAGADARRGHAHRLGVRRRRGRARPVRADVVPVAPTTLRRRSTRSSASPTPRRFWREWTGVASIDLPDRLARRRPPLADDAEGADVRADRRHRRRADDVAAGVDRRRPQLGLPLLLAARRDADAARAAERGTRARGGAVAALAAARGRRRSGRPPDHVRRRRRAAADGVRAAVARRLRGLRAGARRQRCERAAPARRLRRGDGRAVPGTRARPRASSSTRGSCRRRCSRTSRRRGGSRTTASGRSAASGGTSSTRR